MSFSTPKCKFQVIHSNNLVYLLAFPSHYSTILKLELSATACPLRPARNLLMWRFHKIISRRSGPAWKTCPEIRLVAFRDCGGCKPPAAGGARGAEAAKRGWIKELNELLLLLLLLLLGKDSQCGFGLELLEGEERGGVTGALLHTRRKGRIYEVGFLSPRGGLG
ncbi:hypothetical protein MIMGU_mgv1a015212mg [Erythranthe guttata]|uniref:Uncharacterized protein n=1 Tax=Erythranthe guttata TaxID=4155 RepID=A0A022QKW2_ERYGU|nr:hypothetical protein MIMGU_mgv1a015212mg [Erythranthe guttata]